MKLPVIGALRAMLFGPGLGGKLVKAASGSLGLKILATGLGFASSLLLARLLGAGGYGGYVYALAWINLLVVPAILGFEKLTVREVAISNRNKDWSRIKGLTRFSNAVAAGLSVTIAILVYLFLEFYSTGLEPALIPPLQLALILIPLMALSRLRRAALMGYRKIVWGQLPEMAVRPTLFILLIGLTGFVAGRHLSAVDAIIFNIVAVSFALILGAGMLLAVRPAEIRQARPHYESARWIRSAIPLALLASLQLINARVDTVMLGSMKGAEVVGVYNIALQGAGLVSFVLLASNAAVAPLVAQYFADRDMVRLQKLVTFSARAIALFSLPVAAVLVVFGKYFLAWFGDQFVIGYLVLVILVIGQFINSMFGSVGVLLTMTGHERFAAIGAGIAASVNIVLNFLLIPVWGMEGAATASMVTLLLWNGLFAYWVRRQVGIVPTAIGGYA